MSDRKPSLDELLKGDTELSTLPEIYIRISDLLESERSNAAQIGAVVETDPALATRILKMVNSAFYGYPNKIASISQGITILGRDRIRQLLIGSVLSGIFGELNSPVISLSEFWHHSVKTALLSRQLARISKQNEYSEIMFTAGLLHDLGRLILAHRLPEHTRRVEQAIERDDMELCMAESLVFGFTHAEAGGAFIAKWGLPPVLVNTARYHHAPDQATENQPEVELLYLSNRLSYLDELILQDEVESALLNAKHWQHGGLTVDRVVEACVEAEEQVHEVMEALGMGQLVIAEEIIA